MCHKSILSGLGREAAILLDFCQRLNEKFHFSWKMISLVHVILKYTKDQEEAWRQIDEAFLEIRALAAVEAARYTYHHIPYSALYPTTAAIYQPLYLPSIYHPATTLMGSMPPNTSPSHSPPIVPTVEGEKDMQQSSTLSNLDLQFRK